MGDGRGRERDTVARSTSPNSPSAPGPQTLVCALAIAACVILSILRRPEQLSRPYVWDEESVVLRHFLQEGWTAALQPVNGSLNLPAPVLITGSAAAGLPDLATRNAVLALLVFAVTAWILIVPGSDWGGLPARMAMGVGMALCPVDPEVFGVALYSFWWASLWPLIILGWTRPHWGARIPLLAIAALSSPAAGSLFLLFAIRARLRDRREDLVSAGILAVGLVVEITIAITSGRAEHTSHSATRIGQQIARTAGVFVMPWTFGAERRWTVLTLLGLTLTAALIMMGLRGRVPDRLPAALLGGGCAMFALFSALPAPLLSDPRDAGPRYYFLPFTALFWLLVHLAATAGRDARSRVAVGMLAASALVGVLPVFHRSGEHRTGRLDWSTQITRCAEATEGAVDVPIYYNGSKQYFVPKLLLSPAECRAHS